MATLTLSDGQTLDPQSLTGGQPDPKAFKMTKIIKQLEGGDYNNRTGDNGSSAGAYQWNNDKVPLKEGELPSHWKRDATQYLGDPNAPMTPDNQNFVAYSDIKRLKDNGLGPEEIDAIWNGAHIENGEYVHNSAQRQNKFRQVAAQYKSAPNYTTPTNLAIGTGAVGLGAAALGGEGLLGEAANVIGGVASGVKNYVGGLIGGLIGGNKAPAQAPQTPQSNMAQQITENALGQQNNPTNPIKDYAFQILNSQIPQSSKASDTLSNVIFDITGRAKGGRVLMQDPNIQESIQSMGKYGIVPDVDENGALDFTEADKKRNDTIKKLSNSVSVALKDEQSPLSQVVEEAKKGIRQYTPSNEWDEADKHIEAEVAKYAKNFGDKQGNISHENLEKMKSELWHGQKFNVQDTTAKRAAKKSLGYGARAVITKNTQHKEFYNAAMKEEQRLINAGKVMKRLNGTKSPEHKTAIKSLLHAGGRYVALYIGDKIGGPMGAVLGDMVGRHIVGAVDKRHGKTIFETPAVKRAIAEIKKDHPEYYKLLMQELQKHGIDLKMEAIKKKGKHGLLALPSPAIRTKLTDISKLKVLEAKKATHRGKKGRYEKHYTSEGIPINKKPLLEYKKAIRKKAGFDTGKGSFLG